MTQSWDVPGAASSLFLAGAPALLRPEDQAFEAMLLGWRDQQLSRNLNATTIADRDAAVRRFQRFTNEYPWSWRPQDLEEFTAELRGSDRPAALSTIRGYQCAIRLFLDYSSDPRYQWTDACQHLFGNHPSQICFDWNSAAHSANDEGRPQRRALTKVELQGFFDYADDQVAEARRTGNKAWLSMMRDAAAFKVAYAWGLRRRELVMLDLEDFGPNPHAPEFGEYGVVYVRWGKANRGSPPKRRSALTVFDWSVAVLNEWISTYRNPFRDRRRELGAVAERTSLPDRLHRARGSLRRVPGGPRPATTDRHALPPPLLCDPPYRGWPRPPLRAAAGRPLLRLDDRPVHVGLLRLPHPNAARRPRRHRQPGTGPARKEFPIARRLNFHWHLRQLMAAHDMWKTTDLLPLLKERGVDLSTVQIYRLVTDKPERLSMKILTALCDILDCTPSDLIEPYVEASGRRKTAGETKVIDVSPNLRPQRARIVKDE